jgi:hypothetical protein
MGIVLPLSPDPGVWDGPTLSSGLLTGISGTAAVPGWTELQVRTPFCDEFGAPPAGLATKTPPLGIMSL